MSGHYQRRKAIRFMVVALSVATIALPTGADAGTKASSSFTATPLVPDSTITAAKSASGRLATTDPSLLGRTDNTPINVVVKLDYDATASYTGDISGLAATSPRVTGRKLTGKSGAEQAYEQYTGDLDKSFRTDLAATVPSALAGKSLQRVYGGVAVRVPANQVSKLLSIGGVAAVQSDELQHVDTVEGPTFIGAPTVWDQTGGQSLSGQGVIFADLDTGLWPEHPMVADNPALGTPPPAPSGLPRECDFGDNPTTPAIDVFACNSKVIGGQPFLDTYGAVLGLADEVYPDSARDSNGHGTHTSTTAAGNPVTNAPIFGVDRGPISGVAPGAWVIEYKVCGLQGCFGSDSAAAVAQAILDGANVINFSISGGSQPYSDPVELAFLDAYNAGILVAASAGNSGPGAGTTDHHGPWVLTVAASTQSRQFESTLTVTDGADSASFVGTSLTAGVTASTPIVLAENIPGYNRDCIGELDPGTATGVIVACHRTPGRVQKGFNVLAGGAVGMILYNQPLADTESDNHFLPAIHLADGTDFLAFMGAHPTATGSFTDGAKTEGQGDVMASFSSRGPGGQFLKPDITAPGVQVLAGNTPTPDEVPGGPPGEYYQAIAGTSMSAPHIAGSAILMKALHPAWTPGEIKSALMTTANTNVVKEDLVTPADPFDFGAGRVDLTKAGAAAIVFEDTADRMFDLGQSVVTALDLNLPSINVPTMPGTVTVHRTATNVTGSSYNFKVSTIAPPGAKIRVSPSSGRIRAGQSQTFSVTITSNAPTGQYFGQINFDSTSSPALHMPVAFFNQQGDVTLTQSCTPASVRERQTTTCSINATNNSDGVATVEINSKVSERLEITSATGATVNRRRNTAQAGPVTLAAPADGVPAINPGVTPAGGYLDLGGFGVAPIAIGDEENINVDVPPYLFGGKTYSRLGIDSNGYISVGGSDDASDITFIPQTLPDPTPPNGVLAPYWTDLDGTGAKGVSTTVLAEGPNAWIVVQWDTQLFGIPTPDGNRKMQVWIGINGVEDISYEYDAATVGLDTPPGYGLTVGAESINGTEGAQITGPPTGSYVVTSTPGTPGGSVDVALTIRGKDRGNGTLTSSMVADVVAGTTIVSTPIQVTRK